MQWVVVISSPSQIPSLTGQPTVWGSTCSVVGGELTTVVLIGTIPAIIHAIAVKGSGQALGEIPTGKIPFGAQRSRHTAVSQCKIYMKDERRQIQKSYIKKPNVIVARPPWQELHELICPGSFLEHR